jgi:hypothetical protein
VKLTLETAHFVVLSKLTEIGRPMNMLEIGFTATPSVIRNMAARGMIRVSVEITQRGTEHLEKASIRRLRRETKEQRAARRQARKAVSGSAF